ncbi:hypothetical protein TNIN_144481 [Trichonephila inaurata madagascariensis]|uniref:Uncharacterized protein n=1 Tax=Trichonephila inaurata madagascariensis TaxID=2747483 RepID=A0A8X6MC54_9ARAC|nr:hypothetical protein TNIN_144481 [Trichonephila inaurata madagascariensis]
MVTCCSISFQVVPVGYSPRRRRWLWNSKCDNEKNNKPSAILPARCTIETRTMTDVYEHQSLIFKSGYGRGSVVLRVANSCPTSGATEERDWYGSTGRVERACQRHLTEISRQ